MFQNLTGWHALIVLAVIVLIFGAAKLPALAKSVGQSMRILKSEVRAPDDERSAQEGRSDAAASDESAVSKSSGREALAVPGAGIDRSARTAAE